MAISTPEMVEKAEKLKAVRAALYSAIIRHANDKLPKAISAVLALGGDLNKPWAKPVDKYDCSSPPIFLAAEAHNVEAMRLLFRSGKVDHNIERNGAPLMFVACGTGDEAIAKSVLDLGGTVHDKCSRNIHPLNWAICQTIESYSAIFHSNWEGGLKEKERLIAWWKGGEFTPRTAAMFVHNGGGQEASYVGSCPLPLKAKWGGPIPLIALLLKHGANPTLEDNDGFSALKAVKGPTDPVCLASFAGAASAKFVEKNEEGLPVFKLAIKDRRNLRTLEAIVEFDPNMPLPDDVPVLPYVSEVFSSKKTKTMKGLVEAYTPKKLHAAAKRMELDFKELRERVAVVEEQKSYSEKIAVKEVKQLGERFALLQIEHDRVYQAYEVQQTREGRLKRMKGHCSPSVQTFFKKFRQKLKIAFSQCELHLEDLDPTRGKKLDKAGMVIKVVGFAGKFVPPPFNLVGDIIEKIGTEYLKHKKHKARAKVIDLLDIDHVAICNNLALGVSEFFEDRLKIMDPEQAEGLADYGVGAILALLSAEGPEQGEIVLDRYASDEEIQEKIVEAIIKPTKASAWFHKKLEGYSPSKISSMLGGGGCPTIQKLITLVLAFLILSCPPPI